MNAAKIDALGDRAAKLAAEACVSYVSTRSSEEAQLAGIDEMLRLIRHHAKLAIDPALDAAGAALNAGLDGWITAAWDAEFRLAGINAGKEWLSTI